MRGLGRVVEGVVVSVACVRDGLCVFIFDVELCLFCVSKLLFFSL